MPDEVPFQPFQVSQRGVLLLYLLCMALAEEALPGTVGFADGVGGVVFRHRHQPHTVRQLCCDTLYLV